MKHKHLLIAAGAQIDDSTQFFQIWVGASAQDNRDYLFLVALAVHRGWFFHLWDDDTSMFLRNVAKSLGHRLSTLPIKSVQARDFVREAKRQDSSLSNIVYTYNKSVLAKRST